MPGIKLFYSYSQQDESFREEIEKSLIMLKRYDALEDWHFRKIIPGAKWDNEIKKELEDSDIVLLLISRDFLASTYCYDVEFKRALELYNEGKIEIVPIILKACDWRHKNSPIKQFEALPENARPINTWDDVDSAYNDISERLKLTLENIKIKKASTKSNISTFDGRSSAQEDQTLLQQALEVIKQETNKLDYNSSKEDLEKIEILKRELYEQLFSGADEKIASIPKLREKLPDLLFDRICASTKLDTITIQEIQNIRDNKSLFTWYQRKVIINALSLSLISSKQFDYKKANILIDFLTDFEDNVWESALTGLVLSLAHHHNKWGRFDDLKKRLQKLQSDEAVQKGLEAIEGILRYKLYSKSIFNSNIFQNSFFNSPINCFLPFYDNNTVLTAAIESNDTDVDSDHFTKFVTELPLLDCYKYALCLSLQRGSLVQRHLVGKDRMIFVENLNISTVFDPYQNLICEYYNFLSYYPKKNYENIFTNQLTIAKTKLKDVILDKIHELQFSADASIDEDNYSEAINKLRTLLKIDEFNFSANLKIANCYLQQKKPDHSSALLHLKKIENRPQKSVTALKLLIDCYLLKNTFKTAFDYLEKAKKQYPDDKQILVAECKYYEKKENYNQVITTALRACDLYKSEHVFPILAADSYSNLDKHNLAIEYYLKALELCPNEKKGQYYRSLAFEYAEIDDHETAMNYAELSYRIDGKKWEALTTLGRAFILAHSDLKEARKYLERSISIERHAITYGNLGHLELCEGNLEKALNYYRMCITGLGDAKEFEKKFDIDEKFILRYGIGKLKYINIKKDMIKYYNDQKSNPTQPLI